MTITLQSILKLTSILATIATLLLIILDVMKLIETPSINLVILTAISAILVAMSNGLYKKQD